jgi:hypothetical protein
MTGRRSGSERDDAAGMLSAALDAMHAYLHLPSVDHVLFALAVAVSSQLDGDPLWGLIVGAPSSGKTEAVRALDGVADARVNEITPAGLLGWTGTPKRGRRTGLLSRLGPRGFATIGDLSALLAMSDRGARDAVYALLRRAYDGEVVRDIGGVPEPLTWSGRLTLLGAVTAMIDQYSSHADALGPRWLYMRMPETSSEDRRASVVAARRNGRGLAENRARVSEFARAAVDFAVPVAHDATPSPRVERALDDAALVACLGRVAVERESFGQRAIRNVPQAEEPPRLAGQLMQLARGLNGLGLGDRQVARLARRAALDSMPQARRRVLHVLAAGGAATVARVAEEAGLDWKVAKFALEDLATVGVCRGRTVAEETRLGPWALDGPDGALIAGVMAADARETKRRFPTPTPPKKGEGRPTHRPILSEDQ